MSTHDDESGTGQYSTSSHSSVPSQAKSSSQSSSSDSSSESSSSSDSDSAIIPGDDEKDEDEDEDEFVHESARPAAPLGPSNHEWMQSLLPEDYSVRVGWQENRFSGHGPMNSTRSFSFFKKRSAVEALDCLVQWAWTHAKLSRPTWTEVGQWSDENRSIVASTPKTGQYYQKKK